MSNPRDDRYYTSLGKSRRSPPGGDSQSAGFFQSGQGKQIVQLPPLHAAFPTSRSSVPVTYSNQYPQQRSTNPQVRNDHTSTIYGQWSNNPPAQQHSSSFPSYEHHDPRSAQASYPSYSSRASPNLPGDPHSSRKLPPLNMSTTTGREERWQTSTYPTNPPQIPAAHNIRSPTAGYPSAFSPYPPQQSYSYPPVPDPRAHSQSLHPHHQQMHVGLTPTSDRMVSGRADPHVNSPYTRNPSTIVSPSYTSHAETSVSAEEPVIKKKRKRADAVQLQALNDTYNRTAFPSTEERAELAKKLDMTPRSVQIWFQNKRQSMRQTSRPVTSASHQPFSMSSQSNAIPTDLSSGYGSGSGSISPSGMPSSSYMPRTSPDSSRSGLSSQTPPPSHHRRSPESSVDPRKWNGRGY